MSQRGLAGDVGDHPVPDRTCPEREAEPISDVGRDPLPVGLSEGTLEDGGQGWGGWELRLEERPLVMALVGRPKGLQLLEPQRGRPQGGGGRRGCNPVPPFAKGERVFVQSAKRGQCAVDHALRQVRRDALLVRGELVAAAAASAVPVSFPSLARSRRHVGREGALLAVRQGGG